jgi:hypothetical protein
VLEISGECFQVDAIWSVMSLGRLYNATWSVMSVYTYSHDVYTSFI